MRLWVLVFVTALTACHQSDSETAALNRHYAQVGEQMTTTTERIPKTNPKPGQTSQLTTANPPPVF